MPRCSRPRVRPRRSRCSAAGKKIDLALVDVRMPDLDGLELLRAIKAEWADVPVIMLSTYENAPYVKRALSDGAAGYLLKDATPEDLSQAINVAMSGSGNVPQPPRDPEPVRGPAVRQRRERAAQRVQPDPARERHPGVAGRGQVEPRDRAVAVPVREDRQGPPGRDLPQAGRHEPDPGRDDGRADGCRPDAGRAGDRRGSRAGSGQSTGSLGRTGSPWGRAAPGTCCRPSRTASRRAWSAGRSRSARSSCPGTA